MDVSCPTCGNSNTRTVQMAVSSGIVLKAPQKRTLKEAIGLPFVGLVLFSVLGIFLPNKIMGPLFRLF